MNKKAQKILSGAIKLLIQDGIKKVTMDEIAENAKVSKVTIYKYFTDKDTLYLEISRYIFSNYRSQLNNIIASKESIIKKLYTFLDIISNFTNRGELPLCWELSKYNSEIGSEYESYLQTYKSTMLTLIDEGRKNHLIKGDIDSDLIFHYIDMGVVYYQQNLEYRSKMLHDINFQKEFLWFYIQNIFVDGSNILEAL
jgi:AcrR family transcriptional regulator